MLPSGDDDSRSRGVPPDLSGLSHDGGIPFERKQATSLNVSAVQPVLKRKVVCLCLWETKQTFDKIGDSGSIFPQGPTRLSKGRLGLFVCMVLNG